MTKSTIRKSTVLVATIALALLVLLQTASTTVDAAPVGHDDDNDGGLAALTEPLTTGVGRGVAGAAAGTAQTADLLGDAMSELFHVLGGIAANAEQGAGVALANAAPAVEGTVRAVQNNHGLAGDVINAVNGN